jgi:anti-sigma B factor antagonist
VSRIQLRRATPNGAGRESPCVNIDRVTTQEDTQAELRIDARHARDRTVLSLHGELDLASAPFLQSEIESVEAADARLVVLDLDDLEFIDSTGLRIILAAHEHAQEHGQMFALTRGSQQVQRIMSITGIDQQLRIIEFADEQLA